MVCLLIIYICIEYSMLLCVCVHVSGGSLVAWKTENHHQRYTKTYNLLFCKGGTIELIDFAN